jgi:hypothetical protein
MDTGKSHALSRTVIDLSGYLQGLLAIRKIFVIAAEPQINRSDQGEIGPFALPVSDFPVDLQGLFVIRVSLLIATELKVEGSEPGEGFPLFVSIFDFSAAEKFRIARCGFAPALVRCLRLSPWVMSNSHENTASRPLRTRNC